MQGWSSSYEASDHGCGHGRLSRARHGHIENVVACERDHVTWRACRHHRITTIGTYSLVIELMIEYDITGLVTVCCAFKGKANSWVDLW